MNLQWINVIGLAFDILGAIFLSSGLIISKKDAIELGASRINGDTDEQNLDLPQVKDRLTQSRNSLIGLILLLLGFTLQIISNWPQNAINY